MYNILQLLMRCNKCLAMQMLSMCLCLSRCSLILGNTWSWCSGVPRTSITTLFGCIKKMSILGILHPLVSVCLSMYVCVCVCMCVCVCVYVCVSVRVCKGRLQSSCWLRAVTRVGGRGNQR